MRLHRDIRIPLRDGVSLSATLYLPSDPAGAAPAIFTLTPYVAQTYHEQGVYFARRGYVFLAVDVRGRGDSEGAFKPYINEARDGADVVFWVARQPYCNGKVAMWGGSYAGYDQWTTAAELPQALATIVPVASPFFAVDFPIRGNIGSPYWIQWLSLVSGRTSQDRIFGDLTFWTQQFRHWLESGLAFKDLDAFVGYPSAVFQEWVAHPECGDYWDRYNPTAQQYRSIGIPVLTITGIYDGDQLGALMHYRQHLKNATPEFRDRHYLIMGPWDHAGTRTPKQEFGGIDAGAASVIDLQDLHVQWYDWTMRSGERPKFLQQNVAYYAMGANQWRYADSLDEITAHVQPLFLKTTGNPVDVFRSGFLVPDQPRGISEPDHYVYDPRDLTSVDAEAALDPQRWISSHHMARPSNGAYLFYHSTPFETDAEIAGFFRLSLWLSIDTPDTDFGVSIYEVCTDGTVILLSSDAVRGRYRETLRESRLIRTTEPLSYEFDRFPFVSRVIKRGNRLRLVIGPVNSLYAQKNYNNGGVVSEERPADSRVVNVKVFHDERYPSVLSVPYGRSQ